MSDRVVTGGYVGTKELVKWETPPGTEFIGLASPQIQHLSDTSSGIAASPLTVTTFDTTSRQDSAHILLTNSTGSTVILRSCIIKGYPRTREASYVHDSLVDRGDIALNGDSLMEFGGDDIIDSTQLKYIAEHRWKRYNVERHGYSFTISGTCHFFQPGERYQLTAGAAGKAEYVDSFVVCRSVRTMLGDQPTTTLEFYETEEAFKLDSTATSRFRATGRISRSTNFGTVTIGSKYSTNAADFLCTGVADEVIINDAIASVSRFAGSGIVRLSAGTFYTAAAIEMKRGVTLEGEGVQTIIEKNCNDYAIESIGGSGSEVTGVVLRNLTVTRNASDMNNKVLIVSMYSDMMSISNVTTTDADSTAIYFGNCDGVNISGCMVNGYDGTVIGGGRGIFFTSCTDVICSGNVVINGKSGSGIASIGSTGVVIGDCVIRDGTSAAMGLYLVTSGLASVNNVTISNMASTTASIPYGVYAGVSSCQFTSIYINGISNSGTAANARGMYVVGDNNTVSSIYIGGGSGTGMKIAASADRTMISSGRSTANGTNYTDGGTNTLISSFDVT
jgi:hypothetical protein